jgi:cytochrome c oxidase cbb3-type subunit 3
MVLLRTLIIFVAILAAGTAFAEGAAAPDGAALYAAKCASCHGADAKGDTPVGKAMGVKSLLTPAWAGDDAAAKIATAVRDGVPPKMPPMASKLSDAEIEAVAKAVKDMAAAAQ